MAKIQKSTSYPGHEKRKTTPIHDQIQIALALADQKTLIDLLLNAQAPIISFDNKAVIDEALNEISRWELREKGKNPQEWTVTKAEIQQTHWRITCEVEVPIRRKSYAVDAIINYDYYQKIGINIVHKLSNETLSYDWKMETSGQVLVEIKTEIQSWADTLRQIKRYKDELKISKAILVCDTLTPLEAQGFMSQGISIYPATYLTLPIYADCSICVNENCPMIGMQNSPVTICRDFDSIDGWLSENNKTF